MKQKRWKPKLGQMFYAIWVSSDEATVEDWTFWNEGTTKKMWEIGNCFETEKEAQQKLKQIKAILKG